MAIFLKIGSTQYKLPNRIIVGRGEPFTQFNEDRSISRAHLLLVRKKDGIYVKDLGSPTGTVVNGKKLPKNKLTKWNESLELQIGSFQISQHAKLIDKDCIQVSGIKGFKDGHVEYAKWILLAGYILALYEVWTGEDSAGFKAFMSIIFAVITYIMFLMQKLMFKVLTPKNTAITDVFLGEDGLTVHYDAGGNMTLKLHEIKNWRKYLGGAIIKMKNDEVYNFSQMNNRDVLVTYLEKHLPDSQFVPKVGDFVQIAAGALIAFVLIFFDLVEKIPSSAIMGSLLVAVFATSFFMKKGSSWAVNNKHMNPKKAVQMVGGLFILFLAMDIFTPDKREIALADQKACTVKYSKLCKYVQFEHLTKQDINVEKVQLACEMGNKSACKISTRLPASTTK